MLAYVHPGVVASVIFARNKSIHWGMAAWLCAGATPTALTGAWAVSAVDARVLEVALGLLTALSGINALWRRNVSYETNSVSAATLVGVGAGTGFLSSLSGTGGPLVLVPVLLTLKLPALMAIGLSQAIQLPVAIAATIGNYFYGELDLKLAGILAASLTVGSWYGAKLAHSLPRERLRQVVSGALVLTGFYILANVALRAIR